MASLLCTVLLMNTAKAETSLAITNATVHTMGAEGTLQGATILIEDDKIVAVGSDVSVPANTQTIDAAGHAVTPGLMNSYTQFGLSEGSAPSANVGDQDYQAKDSGFGPAFDIRYGLNPHASSIPNVRLHGITRAISAPLSTNHLFAGYGAAIHLGGTPDMIVKPRIAMFAEFGMKGAQLAGGARDAAALKITEAIDDALHYDRNRRAYDRGQSRAYSLNRLDLEALIPVAEGDILLDIAANRASDLRYLIELKDKYGLRIVIRDGREAWMVADELAEANIPVILNPMVNMPMEFSAVNATFSNAARLQAAGVLIAFSNISNPNPSNPEIIRQAAGVAVAHGLPWEEALKAITINPAMIWGLDDQYGTLEPGKDADLVIWDGDPLEVMSYPTTVLIRGVPMPNDSRQIRLRDRYKDLPEAGDIPPAYH